MIRAGMGFDIHRFRKGRPLVLGGVEIPHPAGLDGHSDADALCHAIMDALLGAVADGDIGRHFPNTDLRWRNARSLDMLRTVAGRLKRRGARIVNVDSMVLAEAPRLAQHVAGMRAKLAGAMGVPVDRVSVKATTLEGLGALGRREGLAAMAVATVAVAAGADRGRRKSSEKLQRSGAATKEF
ncbi:MAG: 2-C-methyl-D-erythritol 2,4-cyclodiphosphate synthase [Verrucomicrobiota bacterium]|nr:2-C-methyl-D-erythritol 2,4-cyclodiphosphate synthase [Verrucomicrobiota bacterium]